MITCCGSLAGFCFCAAPASRREPSFLWSPVFLMSGSGVCAYQSQRTPRKAVFSDCGRRPKPETTLLEPWNLSDSLPFSAERNMVTISCVFQMDGFYFVTCCVFENQEKIDGVEALPTQEYAYVFCHTRLTLASSQQRAIYVAELMSYVLVCPERVVECRGVSPTSHSYPFFRDNKNKRLAPDGTSTGPKSCAARIGHGVTACEEYFNLITFVGYKCFVDALLRRWKSYKWVGCPPDFLPGSRPGGMCCSCCSFLSPRDFSQHIPVDYSILNNAEYYLVQESFCDITTVDSWQVFWLNLLLCNLVPSFFVLFVPFLLRCNNMYLPCYDHPLSRRHN
ncbi:unnamed protein product [Ectocarpus sp. 12 AP-2014]